MQEVIKSSGTEQNMAGRDIIIYTTEGSKCSSGVVFFVIFANIILVLFFFTYFSQADPTKGTECEAVMCVRVLIIFP